MRIAGSGGRFSRCLDSNRERKLQQFDMRSPVAVLATLVGCKAFCRNASRDSVRHDLRLGNLSRPSPYTRATRGDNPSCGDEIDLGVKFGADGSVDEIKFGGHGCAISQASLSMMTMKLKGKSRAAAREMLGAFHDLVAGENDGCLSAPRETCAYCAGCESFRTG